MLSKTDYPLNARTLRPVLLSALVASTLALAQANPPAKPLPPGPMQPKIKAACTQCHAADRITEKHFSREQWSDELDKMTTLGAAVPDSQHDAFLDYLTANFGPLKGVVRKTRKDAAANSDAK